MTTRRRPRAAPGRAGGRRSGRLPALVPVVLAPVALAAACGVSTGDGSDDGTAAAPPATTSTAPPSPSAPVTSAPAPDPSPSGPSVAASPEVPALGASGVSSGHPVASRIGMDVLDAGGNAVDAAVATAFADAVITPSASGIGGGGVALVAVDGEVRNYDYRDVVNQDGEVPSAGAGVPGFVAGLHRLHADHGGLPWAQVVAPASALARQGSPVSGFLAGAIAAGSGQRATGDLPQFRRDGGPLREGDVLVQEELAATLDVIAADGPDALYRGELSDELAAVPGLDEESLAAYEVRVAAPAAGPLGDYTVLSAAPPHPGAAIIQMLQVAEAAGIGTEEPGSAGFVDLQTRAWLVAEDSVEDLIGDPAFVEVPVERLTDPRRNADVATDLPPAGSGLAAGAPADDGPGNTTHISVVDADGSAVSMTNTVTNYWGSEQEVLGFFVNDSLERFGEIGTSDTNSPAPGRRSVTWSSPTMLLDADGRVVLVLGSPGGRQIPNVLGSVVNRWALFGQDLADAVPADRFFESDGGLSLESDDLAGELQDLGWSVEVLPASSGSRFGSVQALAVDWESGEVTGVADTRRSAGVELDPTG